MARNDEYDAIARARNAAKQARDKNGRFIEMNGTMRYKSGGTTKSGTIIGISGGFAYFLPPIKNATHRPQPYRVPLSALEMYKPKASLKDKKDRDHEKKYIAEQTKLFESKLTPNRRKEQQDQQNLVKEAKKKKLDVDYAETDDDGIDHLNKFPETEPDPKVQAGLQAVLPTLNNGEKFDVPLDDGFKMSVSKEDGQIIQTITDSEGKEHSRQGYSDKKSEAEVSQEIARNAKRFNDLDDVRDLMIDLDGDGIPDINDPLISFKPTAKTPAKAVTKEDLEAAPIGTTLINGKNVYIKSARLDPERGSQWARYEESGGSHHLLGDDLYADDLVDGTKYQRPSAAISEESVGKIEDLPEDHPDRIRDTRRKMIAEINDKDSHTATTNERRGFKFATNELLAKLPVTTKRDDKKKDQLAIPTEDFSLETLKGLPQGSVVSLKQRNGSIARATRLRDGSWYTPKNFNDSATDPESRRTHSSEYIFDFVDQDGKVTVRASSDAQIFRDLNKATSQQESFLARLDKEAGRDPEARYADPDDLFTEPEPDSVSGAEALAQLRQEQSADSKDPVGTKYMVKEGEDEDATYETYTKRSDGTVTSGDGSDIYDSAEDFDSMFTDPRNNQRAYDKELPDTDDVDEDAPVSPKVNHTAIEIPEEVIEPFTVPDPVDNRQTQAQYVGGYNNHNPLTSIEANDGEVYELDDTQIGRNSIIHQLFREGLIDVDTFDPALLYDAAEGEETGRFYADGSPVRIGDEVLYNTRLRENGVNSGEYIWARSVVTGIVAGKGDIKTFPLETVVGKKRGKVVTEEGQVLRPTVEESYGPELILSRKIAYRQGNSDTIQKISDDGSDSEGVREEVNVSGRTSTFSVDDLYSQDAQHISKGATVQFRIQNPEMNETKDGEFIPFETIHTGEVLSVNAQNQSIAVVLPNGRTVNPSIKNTTVDPSVEPVRPENIKELELPDGYGLDNQGRVLQDSSIAESKVASDEISRGEPATVEDLERIFGEVEKGQNNVEGFNPEAFDGEADTNAEEETKSDVDRLRDALRNTTNHVDAVNEFLGRKGSISEISQEEYDSLDSPEGYRGVSGEGVEAFYRSELGNGGPGSGIYYSDSESEARGFAGAEGEVIPLKLSEEAKVATIEDINEGIEGLDDSEISSFISTADDTTKAAFLGYDAIDMTQEGSSFREGNYVVVNPSVVVTPSRVQEARTPSNTTPRTRRRLVDSVSTQQEYDSSIPRYFRDRKEKEYANDFEKATDWSNAPVGSTIRLKGGTYAVKTGDNSWDFRKSSKHLTHKNLSNKKLAATLESNPEILGNARASSPTRKKYLEYNGGRVQPSKVSASRKAPEESTVEVEGDTLTKTANGWQGDNDTLLSNNQMDTLMRDNPEEVRVTKVPVSKIANENQKVAVQDSLFELTDDGNVKRVEAFGSEPSEVLTPEEADSVAGQMTDTFDLVTVEKTSNPGDDWSAVETVNLDSNGNIVFSLDDSVETTARQVMDGFVERLSAPINPPQRLILDEGERFSTVSAYAKPNPDGGYDLVVNPDGVTEADIASALADGARQDAAKAQGISPRELDENILREVSGDDDVSKSYDQILQDMGIRSTRKGSAVAEAFRDVWENGEDANPTNLNIWERYASESEMVALYRRENGTEPQSKAELDKYRRKL